jgi:hypothetical protein
MSFSIPALIVLLVILIPNLLFLVFPPKDMPGQLKNGGVLLNIMEQGGRILFFVIFPFTARTTAPVGFSLYLCLAILFAFLYELLWLRYFHNQRAFRCLFGPVLGIPVPMALFPILSFAFAAGWLSAYWALIPLAAFGIGHIVNTWITAQQIHS